MTPFERVKAVLSHEIPDRVPRTLYGEAIGTYNQTTLDMFAEKTGRKPSEVFQMDMRGILLRDLDFPEEDRKQMQNLSTVDEVNAIFNAYSVKRPCLEIDDLKLAINKFHKAGYPAMIVSPVSDVETPFALRGREQFFMDLAYQEEFLPVFLDRITDIAVQNAELAAKLGADIFGIGDDLGSQRGLLISPKTWREFFKPRLKRIIDAVKNTNNETAFFFHSDGKIDEIIPDLIEVGVNILNPIQPEVMDPAKIKKDFGKDLIFFGGISVQQTLPFGKPEDIFNEVKLRMETIGKDGGYIMSPSHLVNEDIPWENIAAFFEAADKYGRY